MSKAVRSVNTGQTFDSNSDAAVASSGAPMTEPLLWVALGALAVQAALCYAKELQPVHFWVLTLFNWSCLFALPYAIHTAYL